jgi:hypothetical protein
VTIDSTQFFVSHTQSDRDFALRVAKEIRAAGGSVWIDRLDIVAGQQCDVASALHTCRGVIVILSPESVAAKHVMDEVSHALRHDKRIVPILRAQCKIPYRLERLPYADFTTSYEIGMADLRRALALEDSGSKRLSDIYLAQSSAHTLPPFRSQSMEGTDAVRRRDIGLEQQTRSADAHPYDPGASQPIGSRRLRYAGVGALLGLVPAVIWTILVWQMRVGVPFGYRNVLIVTAILMAGGAVAGAVARDRKLPALLAGSAAGIALVIGVALAFQHGQQSNRIGVLFLVYGVPLSAVLGASVGTTWVRSRNPVRQ